MRVHFFQVSIIKSNQVLLTNYVILSYYSYISMKIRTIPVDLVYIWARSVTLSKFAKHFSTRCQRAIIAHIYLCQVGVYDWCTVNPRD